MTIGCCFICVFAVLINKVSLQIKVHKEAVIGGSVVLPCSSTERGLKLEETDVLWRHNDSENVYDLVKGKVSVTSQNPRYQNRAETFPDEYLKGNFSLRLNNLIHTDAGAFSCIFTHSAETQTVQLIINGSTVEKGINSTVHGNQGPETSPDLKKILISVGVTIAVIAVIAAISLKIYRGKKAHYREQSQSES